MKVVLIRNYLPDKQESMKRFADMLQQGFEKQGISVVNWMPAVFFGKLANTTLSGIGKWLGYIDKWILFPIILRCRCFQTTSKTVNTFYHICDHSNSPYLNHLPKDRSGITCHDVLAIRGALGYTDAYCPASTFGKILQKWILKNLSKASYLACVSQLTFKQLQNLIEPTAVKEKTWTVIHNAFNAEFTPMSSMISQPLLAAVGVDTTTPFILHVGSALQRKNRKLLVDIVYTLGDKWKGNICFAGQAIDENLQKHIKEKGLTNRVVSVVKPDHSTLVALYSTCEAFIFPSYSEGFGWPVIEAQACGVPVIASNIEPMPEVSGGAAVHADPNNVEAFASALLLLKNKEVRCQLISKGFENVKKFALSNIIQEYIKLYATKSEESNVS